MDRVDVNVDALKSEIRRALINQKANACPIAMRMAWHASGTFDKNTKTGGCNGATMVTKPAWTSLQTLTATPTVRGSCCDTHHILWDCPGFFGPDTLRDLWRGALRLD